MTDHHVLAFVQVVFSVLGISCTALLATILLSWFTSELQYQAMRGMVAGVFVGIPGKPQATP